MLVINGGLSHRSQTPPLFGLKVVAAPLLFDEGVQNVKDSRQRTHTTLTAVRCAMSQAGGNLRMRNNVRLAGAELAVCLAAQCVPYCKSIWYQVAMPAVIIPWCLNLHLILRCQDAHASPRHAPLIVVVRLGKVLHIQRGAVVVRAVPIALVSNLLRQARS